MDNPKTEKTFDYAFDNGIPLILLLAESELKAGKYMIKELNTNIQHEVS